MNNQIKLINSFITFLPTKSYNNEKYYVLNDELRNNQEILDICIDYNIPLVKNFQNNNWSNIRKAKKRIIQTIKNCLKIFGTKIIKKQISRDTIRDGKLCPSTTSVYIFIWDDIHIDIGKFDINEYNNNMSNNQMVNKKQYHKQYYINNKETMTISHNKYMDKRYNRN